MSSAKQQVAELIQDYQTAVYRAVALLNAKSEKDRGFQQHEESPGYRACPYPKLKRPSGHMAGRAFLRGCLSGQPLSKRGQPAKKGLCVTSGKAEKDLGKDKTKQVGVFVFSTG